MSTGSAAVLELLCAEANEEKQTRTSSQIQKGLKDCMIWRVYLNSARVDCYFRPWMLLRLKAEVFTAEVAETSKPMHNR